MIGMSVFKFPLIPNHLSFKSLLFWTYYNPEGKARGKPFSWRPNLIFFFQWYWGLKSGPHTWQAGVLLLEPHPSPSPKNHRCVDSKAAHSALPVAAKQEHHLSGKDMSVGNLEAKLIPYFLSTLCKDSIKGGQAMWNIVIHLLYSLKLNIVR
jgi:hypothetical protein